MSKIGSDTNLPCQISEDISKLRRYSASGVNTSVITDVKWDFSDPPSVILNPFAKSFNYASRISNTPDIPILLNIVGNVAAHNSLSEIISNLDSCAKPFIPGTCSHDVISSLNENRFQLETDGDGIFVSKSSLPRCVDDNKLFENFYNLNPHTLSFSPSDLVSNNILDKIPLSATAVTFIPPKSRMSVLNLNANAFVPRHRALSGVHVLSIILFLILTFVIMILRILNFSGELSKNVMAPKESIRKLKFESPNKLIIGHLNINSIRNKFECLFDIVGNNIDIFLISETKLNNTFPSGQFLRNGFQAPFRKDRTDKGGGLLLYIGEHIPCRELKIDLESQIETIFVEINLKKRKWLLIGAYNPDKNKISIFLDFIESKLNELCIKYENIILMGDLNSQISEDRMNIFCNTYNFKNLVKEPTCFKSIENPSCVDLILTNKSLYFQHTSVIETGLSDFHKLTLTQMKSTFKKQQPKILNYRNYKCFNNVKFREELLQVIDEKGGRSIGCEQFESLFLSTLNKHAPQKKRYVRANNSPFMTNELYKGIMVRSRLRNKFLKLKTLESRDAYKRQRNYCVSLLRATKKSFYENLDPNLITDNRKFWKQVKPFFSDKTPFNNNITLLEGNEIVTDNSACAEILNNFFCNSVNNLEIDRNFYVYNEANLDDPIDNIIEKFKYHPSIVSINQKGFKSNNFFFQLVSEKDVFRVISNIDSSKAYQKNNIPPKILKDNADIVASVLCDDINMNIDKGKFPSNLKNADISPLFKKLDRMLKTNYRAVSILPTLSKIYEKLFYQQLYDYFNNIFSKYLCGFRKGHSTQHCLLFMLEKLKKALDKGLTTGILLTDLTKAFDCISHDLLIAKLNAYGFYKITLNLIYDYLSGRQQRTKVNDRFSTWHVIIHGVPQGSVLGPLLFNIYINDLFFTEDFQMMNFADDCSPYNFSSSINEVIQNLENQTTLLVGWYKYNYLKPNPDKWHLILSESEPSHFVKVNDKCIFNSKNEKVLGVYFDNKLNFECHLGKLCKRASQKFHALVRVSSFMSCRQKKIIMNAFITSQFGYCPLIWMCHNRKINRQINKIHERALRIVYMDNTSSFDELLIKSGSVSIHHRNLQQLAIEIYKALNNSSSTLMSELFKIKESKYNFRNEVVLASNHPSSTNYGINSVSHLAPKIWELIPNELRKCKSLNLFKEKIKTWIPRSCPCNLCRTYIHGVGFI